MAAYQQQPQLQQQQFGNANYPQGQPVANNSQGQMSPAPVGQGGHPGWQAQPAQQTHNQQAWQQSQLYEYQQQQLRLQQQHQQPQWQQSPSPPPQQQHHQGQQGQQFAQQQSQQLQHQQSDDTSPHRQSSFVGLPPIRRTSTMMSSVVNAGMDQDDTTSVASSSQRPNQGQQVMAHSHPPIINPNQMPMQMQMQGQMQPAPQQFIPGAYRPIQQGQMPQGQQGLQNNNAYLQNMQVGMQSSPQPRQEMAMMNGDPRFPAQGQPQGSPQPQFMAQGMRPQQPASVLPNAGDQIRLPPQGAWKLEESHLQQPLLSPNRNRSSSNVATQQAPQPYFGFDKETNLPISPPAASAQQQPPQDGQQPGMNGQGQQTQTPQPGQMVARTDTDLTADTGMSDLEPPSVIPAATAGENRNKRNSGIFSGIRERFAKDGTDGRRESAVGPSGKPPGAPQQQSGPVPNDAVSESSVATQEIQDMRKRQSLMGMQGPSQLSQPPQQQRINGASPPANSPPVDDGRGSVTPQGPPSPFDPRTQQPQMSIAPGPAQMPPPENKRTFFGGSNGNGNSASPPQQGQNAFPRPDMLRPSTSSTSIQQAEQPSGQPGGTPKKRFSNLKDMFHRSGHNDQGQRPPGSAHSARPSMGSIPQGQPAPGPRGMNMPPQQGQAFARPLGAQGQPSFQGGHAMQVQQGQSGQHQPGQSPQPGQQQPGQSPHFAQQLQQGPPVQQRQQLQPGQQPQPQLQPGQQPQHPQQGAERRLSQTPTPTQPLNGQKTPQGQQYPFPNNAQQQVQQQLQPSAQQQLQQQFQQQAQHQQQQPGMMAPPPATGRERSGSTGSGRSFTPGVRPNPMMQNHSSGSEERGRKPSSGGGFLSSILSSRSGSKPRDSKKEQAQGQPQGPGQGQPQQRIMLQPGQVPPGQQPGQFAQFPGQQPPPGAQYRIPSPLGQQQTGPRPGGPPGQLAPGQPGHQELMSQGPPGQQQFAQMQGQQMPQDMIQQGGPAGQAMQGQAGGPRPMMAQQQLSQQSQTSPAPGTVPRNQQQGQQPQQPGLMNGQRLSQQGPSPPQAGQQPHQAQQQQQRPLGPLNQHPVASSPSPPMHGFPVPNQGSNHIALQQSQLVVDRRLSGSPQLGSRVSQMSQPAPFTPVEPSRQQTDSPVGFRQPLDPCQSLHASSPTPPAESSPRKPVPSSPKPSEPSLAGGERGGQVDQGQRSPSVSAMNSLQNSPVQYSRRPSTQQLSSQAGSPLIQKQQLANPQQPLQPSPGQASPPAGLGTQHPGPGQQPGFPGQGPQPGMQPGHTPGGPGQMANQQGIRPGGQQPMPTGQAAPGQQGQQPLQGPQAQWMLNRTSTGASGPMPPQQGQPGTPYFQAHAPNNGSNKEHQGTISKLFKSKTSGPGQEKAEKEKGAKSSLFGFRRSKQQGPPPGRMVQLSPSQDRLRQLQAQAPGQEHQPGPGSSPSPGPHMQYQHQRQTPPNGTPTGQTPPAQGQPPNMASQQGPPPPQTPASGPPQQQQQNAAGPQQGVPPPGHFQRGQSFPPTHPNHGQPQQGPLAGSGQQPVLLNQRQMSAPPKTNEPQYAQVPIPGGYGFVRAEGRVDEPPPVAYPVAYYIGPNGQYLPVQNGPRGPPQQGQPWMQPGMAPGQGPPGGQPPQQHMMHNPGQPQFPPSQQSLASPPAPVAPANTPSLQQQQQQVPAGRMMQQQPQPQTAPSQQTRTVSPFAQGQTPQATPNPGALSPISVLPSPTHGNSFEMRPEPVNQLTNGASPLPQLQHPASPQSYPLPNTMFSPVNPTAAGAPNPPLPNSGLADLVPGPLRTSGQLNVPSRQPSAVSQLSYNSPPAPTSASPAADDILVDGRSHFHSSPPGRSPSLQRTPPDRVVSPEPPSQSPPPGMNISVRQANQHNIEHDNIYDATPRTPNIPVSAQEATRAIRAPEEPAEPKSAGPSSHEVLEHRIQVDQKPPPRHLVVETAMSPTPSPPPVAQVAREPEPVQVMVSEPVIAAPAPIHPVTTSEPVISAPTTTPGPSQPLHIDTQTNGFTPPRQNPNPIDVFEEARRKAFLRDMEEKIPVFPTEPDMNAHTIAANEATKKGEERPQMSATSYPGQEWNPYGEGYEDFE